MSAVVKQLSWTAEGQHGYVTRAQAVEQGVSDQDLHRAVTAGVLARPGRGVYRVVGAPEHFFEPLWVAWLQREPARHARERARNPDMWVSHASASRLLELGVLAADTHEFSSVSRRQSRREDVVIHQIDEPLARGEYLRAHGMPVTGVARIVADLDDNHTAGNHLGRIVIDALGRGMVTEQELVEVLGRNDPDPAGKLEALREEAMGKFVYSGVPAG